MTELVGADLVREFYAAVARRDAATIGGLIDEGFASDVVLDLPPSLPYGGRTVGSRNLKRLFTAMATSDAATGPTGVRVCELIDGGDHVAVQLDFEWYAPGSNDPLPSTAVEIWTLTAGRVSTIRAFYWDTAQCLERVAAVAGVAAR